MKTKQIKDMISVDACEDYVNFLEDINTEDPQTDEEFIKSFFVEAICVGGDLGPDGNEYFGTDLGLVNTDNFFNKWLKILRNCSVSHTCKMIKQVDKYDTELGSDYEEYIYCDSCYNRPFQDNIEENILSGIPITNYATHCPFCGAEIENKFVE